MGQPRTRASAVQQGSAHDAAQGSAPAGDATLDLQTDGRRKYPRSRLLASSAERGWRTLGAELRCHPPGRIISCAQDCVEIVIAVSGSDDGLVIRAGAGRQEQARPVTGAIWLAPTGVGREDIVLTAPMPKALHLYLPLRQFDTLADRYSLPRSLARSIQYVGGLDDALIRQIGAALLAEVNHETATGRMFAETASLMLAARLIHGYAAKGLHEGGAGAPTPLDSVRLQRVLDCIEQHLEQEITVATLAEQAHLSAFHFTRMFTAALGVPPYRYVSRRRLEAAMAMLARGKLPLSEVAHRSGFSSQASFTRAFRRATGMAPGAYRRLMR
ncbi:AraC family transcriptional regulator [Bradyrhizobium sp. ARR65]|uniref:helix-turn-helix domain-containing protein n=1 Tax=Bradyrhizobium sp. ARR65 TaxID=1040989 RepID=UPI000B339B0A|nr:AraC family transcriptional regulator [Bradyrhizobium sp. ARR65]